MLANFNNDLQRKAIFQPIVTRILFIMTILWIPLSVFAQDSCLSAVGKAAIDPCRRALLKDPANADFRIALSDALILQKQYQEAVELLQQGFEFSPGDDRLKKKLALTESYLDEQQWIKKRNEEAASASSSKKQETQLRLSLIRCKKLKGQRALAACSQGLKIVPNHPDLLVARGEVLLNMGTPGPAMADFNKALAADPSHRGAAKGLRLAGAKRKVLISRCLNNDGPDAMAACESALIKGAPDALDIHKRRALLLVAEGKKKEAIAAYQAALEINPKDGESEKALVALMPPKKSPPAKKKEKPISKPSVKKEPSTVKNEGEPPARRVAEKQATVEKKQTVKEEPSKIVEIKKKADNPDAPVKPKPAQVALSSTEKMPETGDSKPGDLVSEKPKPPVRFSNLPEVEGITH